MDKTEGTRESDAESSRDESMEQPGKGTREKVSDGIRQGLGVLSAFKDALEETIQEARDRGDLSPERAKEALRSAMTRAQEAAGEARERFDFVPRADFDELRERVEECRVRLENLERRVSRGPGTGTVGEDGP